MTSIFTVTNNDLEQLGKQEAVAVFRELLWAEARTLGLPCNKIHVSDEIDVADGGIDATVEADALTNIATQDGLIKAGKTSS